MNRNLRPCINQKPSRNEQDLEKTRSTFAPKKMCPSTEQNIIPVTVKEPGQTRLLRAARQFLSPMYIREMWWHIRADDA